MNGLSAIGTLKVVRILQCPARMGLHHFLSFYKPKDNACFGLITIINKH